MNVMTARARWQACVRAWPSAPCHHPSPLPEPWRCRAAAQVLPTTATAAAATTTIPSGGFSLLPLLGGGGRNAGEQIALAASHRTSTPTGRPPCLPMEGQDPVVMLGVVIPDGCPVGGLVTAIVLCVVFGLILCMTVFQIVCIRMRSSLCSGQLVLHSLILVSLAARFVNLVIGIISTEPVGFCPTTNATNHTTPNLMPLLQTPPTETVAFVISVLPTAIFFSVNSYLVLTWSKIYFSGIKTDERTRVVMKTLFIATNIVCAGLVLAEIIFACIGVSEGTVMNQVSNILIVLLFLALGVSFPILGCKVRDRLSNVPIIKSSRQAKVAEVNTVAAILTTVFLLRSLLIVVLPRALANFTWTRETIESGFGVYCFLAFMYYAIFEAFPSITVLWNQRRLPPKLNSDFSSVGDLGGIDDLTDSLVN